MATTITTTTSATPTWREQMGQVQFKASNGSTRSAPGASFRGVPFHTREADVAVGRRNEVHEYPQRDLPYVEDLGRRARVYSVEGYVIGPDYMAQRDALQAALETSGPGELKHPRYGTLWVAVHESARIRETVDEGGVARFSITFIEAGLNELPNGVQDTVSRVGNAATNAQDAANAAFADAADVKGPDLLADSLASSLKNDLAKVASIARNVCQMTVLTDLLRNINSVVNDVTDIIRTPVDVAQGLQSLQQQLLASVARPGAALAEFRAFFNDNKTASTEATNAGVGNAAISGTVVVSRVQANDEARAALQRRTAVVQQAQLISLAISGDDIQAGAEATEQRDLLLAQIDYELENADPDVAMVAAMIELRAAVVRDVGERVERLRERAIFTSKKMMPSLVLAHRIFQDATRADEIEARNNVVHPAFVPAGDIEVLL